MDECIDGRPFNLYYFVEHCIECDKRMGASKPPLQLEEPHDETL